MKATLEKLTRLKSLKNVFAEIAGEDGQIDAGEFQRALKIKDDYFAAKAFSLFDSDGTGTINLNEFLDGIEHLVSGTDEDRLRFAFNLYDADGGGAIEKHELDQLIKAGMVENGLAFSPRQVSSMVAVLFYKADTQKSGNISFEEFKQLIEKHPDLMEGLTLSPVSWLNPRAKVDPAKPPRQERAWSGKSFSLYLENNRIKLAFLAAYIIVNVWLAAAAVRTYAAAGENIYVQIARAGGAMLNFNGALILFPMMRNFLTWLRKTPLNRLIPIDESVKFHKLVGYVMFVTAIIHTSAHFFNYATLKVPFAQSLLATRAGLTGLILLIVFTIMVVTALEPVRKGGNFKTFYLAHLGYVIWLIMLLLHGPQFWKWFLVAGIGFGSERILRSLRSKEPAYAINAYMLPSNVLGLEVERPPNFHYRAGDYVFVKCPEVSGFEWHPFTISSAPQDEKILSVLIRATGSWTGALYKLFNEKRRALRVSEGMRAQVIVPVYLDGPYGTPSSNIFESKNAILIGSGIGVTPFASVLKSILLRIQSGDYTMHLQKVHFFWINRGQYSFEWFLELLARIEAEDRDGLFDLHLYLTGVHKKSDMKSSALFIAMDLLHEHTKVDLITGLKTQTELGRPNWEAHFRDIASQHPGEEIDVYFSGAKAIAKELGQMSDRFGFKFHKESF